MRKTDFISSLKLIKKEIKSSQYDNWSLDKLKKLLEDYHIGMAMYEEDMTLKQADDAWKCLDYLEEYMKNRFPEYEKECEKEEAKYKAWEEEEEKKGNIIHFSFTS